MLRFRKKVTVESFWQPRLEGMFSGKNEPGWDTLKASFHDLALNAVEPSVFYSHMQAMTIEIANIVIAKRYPMDVSTASMVFVSEFLKKRNRLDVDQLIQRYSSAFGSSSADGIRQIVELFSKRVSESRLAPSTVEGLCRTLYMLVEEVANILKSAKLVPSPRNPANVLKCPRCRLINPRSSRRCDCGYIFPNYAAESQQLPFEQVPLAWLDVTGLPGVTRDHDGALQCEFTEGEKEAVAREFNRFKGPGGEILVVHPEVHDELQNALTARGLWFYTDDQVSKSGISDFQDLKALNNAVAALAKAYSLYPLPTFLRYLGILLKILGEPGRSERALAEWKKRKLEFKPSQVAKMLAPSLVASPTGRSGWSSRPDPPTSKPAPRHAEQAKPFAKGGAVAWHRGEIPNSDVAELSASGLMNEFGRAYYDAGIQEGVHVYHSTRVQGITFIFFPRGDGHCTTPPSSIWRCCVLREPRSEWL